MVIIPSFDFRHCKFLPHWLADSRQGMLGVLRNEKEGIELPRCQTITLSRFVGDTVQKVFWHCGASMQFSSVEM